MIEDVNRYKFDGVTVRYGGAMDAAATQAAATIVSKLSSLTGKILMAEGNPLFIAKESHDAITYFVLTTTDAVNTFNIRSQLAYATDYAGIALEKIIITAEPGGKLHFRPALLLFCECFRAFCGGGSALFFASFARKW